MQKVDGHVMKDVHRIPGWMLFLMALLVAGQGTGAYAQPSAAQESATLRFANRDIATFHSSFTGAPPVKRADRAAGALHALGDSGRMAPVSLKPFTYEGKPAISVVVGNDAVFALLPGDTPVEGRPLEIESAIVLRNLQRALQAERIQRRPDVLLHGILVTLVASALAWFLLWGIRVGSSVLEAWLLRRMERDKPRDKLQWRDYARPLITRIIIVLGWVVQLLVLYIWLAVALAAFPLTRPLGAGLRVFFGDRLRDLLRGLVEAAPGLATVLLILLLTRAVAEGVRLFFDNVHAGRIRAHFIHRETASATKRLVTIAVWAMGVAIAYPHIPGSSSDAFKGVSVMLGLVLTLGSAGVVNQLMSGMVVVYSRALRRGDLVEVDGIEARVVEVGSLATKLVNINRQEITIPNSVLVGNAVRNYSKLADDGPIFLSVKVTIGYDAPWRQVHQILLEAVADTPELGKAPEPFVLQRGLSDFYVEYEVFAALREPQQNLSRKPLIMSSFNANIQDAFNRHGVQIMSPHFEAQPEQSVVIPPEKWFPSPTHGRSSPDS